MQARVKDTYFLGFAQAAGIEFIKKDFRPVPEHAEEEIKKASFLEIFEGEEIDAKAAADSVATKGKAKVKVASGGKIEKPKVEKKKAAAKPKSNAVEAAIAKAEAAEKKEAEKEAVEPIEAKAEKKEEVATEKPKVVADSVKEKE